MFAIDMENKSTNESSNYTDKYTIDFYTFLYLYKHKSEYLESK